jgi:hypothetical protein
MMSPVPAAAAMALTLVDRGVDLSDDRAIIMCLVNAGYNAALIGEVIDLAIARARRMRDARETLQLDAALGAVAKAMGADHEQA